jgi:hypothetical protein
MKQGIAGWVLTLGLGVASSFSLANGLALAAGGRDVSTPAARLEMAFRDGRLTARVVAAPLHEVMAEIGRLTGAKVRWLNQYGDERVSLQLADVPLDVALEKILQKNFTLSYASSGILTGIWISSRGTGGEPAGGPQAGAVTNRLIAVEDRGEPPTGRNQPRARTDPGAGLGDEPAPSRAGIDVAEQPLSVRMEAVELLAMHADEDEGAREVLAHMAASDVDLQVRAIASKALGVR